MAVQSLLLSLLQVGKLKFIFPKELSSSYTRASWSQKRILVIVRHINTWQQTSVIASRKPVIILRSLLSRCTHNFCSFQVGEEIIFNSLLNGVLEVPFHSSGSEPWHFKWINARNETGAPFDIQGERGNEKVVVWSWFSRGCSLEIVS